MRNTIYKNHPDGPAGYLVRNRKTIKFDAVERTTHYNVYPNQLNRLKRVENCIPSNHSPCFLKLPKIPRTVWFSNPNFSVFPCKFKAVARADVIHFVNLCAAVFSTLFVIVFYFIVISFFFFNMHTNRKSKFSGATGYLGCSRWNTGLLFERIYSYSFTVNRSLIMYAWCVGL